MKFLQYGCAHLGSQMAHNLCCDLYHVHNMTYIYHTIVIIFESSTWRVLFPGAVVHWLGFWLLCPLWLYWFFCFLVFKRMGWGWWGVPVHLFFVVCYCFLFWISCFLFNSGIMKSDLSCSVVTVWILRRA